MLLSHLFVLTASMTTAVKMPHVPVMLSGMFMIAWPLEGVAMELIKLAGRENREALAKCTQAASEQLRRVEEICGRLSSTVPDGSEPQDLVEQKRVGQRLPLPGLLVLPEVQRHNAHVGYHGQKKNKLDGRGRFLRLV